MDDPRHRMPQVDYPLPIVADVSWANGLAILRGLGAKGLRSMALSSQAGAPGFYSRYAEGITCPSPDGEPEELIELLCELGRALPTKGVLLLTDDHYLMAIARHWDELSCYYYSSFPSWDILQAVMDKQVQLTVAQNADVGVPRTAFLDSGVPTDLSAMDVGWPAIIKGRRGKGFARALGRQVLLVNSPQEAEAARQRFGEYDLLLQEIIPGGDDQLYTYGSYLAPSGQPLASFTGRKLRQRPPGFGVAIAAESLDLPDLAEEGLRLLRALGFHGPSQVEFKRDPRDGRYKLMEVNARFWSWHGLATFCGANIAYATYCNALGQPVEPQVASGHKGWILWFYDLLLTGRRVAQHQYSLRHWLRTLPFPMMDGIFDPDDPLPALMAATRLARQGMVSVSDRLVGRRQRPLAGTVSAGDLGLIGRADPDNKRH